MCRRRQRVTLCPPFRLQEVARECHCEVNIGHELLQERHKTIHTPTSVAVLNRPLVRSKSNSTMRPLIETNRPFPRGSPQTDRTGCLRTSAERVGRPWRPGEIGVSLNKAVRMRDMARRQKSIPIGRNGRNLTGRIIRGVLRLRLNDKRLARCDGGLPPEQQKRPTRARAQHEYCHNGNQYEKPGARLLSGRLALFIRRFVRIFRWDVVAHRRKKTGWEKKVLARITGSHSIPSLPGTRAVKAGRESAVKSSTATRTAASSSVRIF